MLEYAEPVTKLIDELKRLPGIGHKSAQRLAFHIMRTPENELERLLTDHVLREQLGVKAAIRSGEFSWPQSADAMRAVLESVHAGRIVSGVV